MTYSLLHVTWTEVRSSVVVNTNTILLYLFHNPMGQCLAAKTVILTLDYTSVAATTKLRYIYMFV